MIDITKLTPADKGRLVMYSDRVSTRIEEGVISSWNEHYIFVTYRGDFRAKATPPYKLDFTYDQNKK